MLCKKIEYFQISVKMRLILASVVLTISYAIGTPVLDYPQSGAVIIGSLFSSSFLCHHRQILFYIFVNFRPHFIQMTLHHSIKTWTPQEIPQLKCDKFEK